MKLTTSQQDYVVRLLGQQIEVYRQALPIAETLAESYDLSPQRQNELGSLDKFMIVASQYHIEMMKIVGEFPESTYPDPIKNASRQLTEILKKLIPMIDQIEMRAREVKANLNPDVNQSIRAQQMQTAYGSSIGQ